MITTVQFVAEHVHKLREMYPDHVLGLGPDPTAFVRELEVKEMAFTALKDGKPLGCAGVLPLWKGVGEAWALFSPELLKHPMYLHRAVKRGLYDIQRRGKFHRIQCIVLDAFQQGAAWARRLGFTCEGPLGMYCPLKLNYKRFALLTSC